MTEHKVIQLYKGQHERCNYLPESNSSNQFVDPSLPLTTDIYSQLIEYGFRRSGGILYRPDCFSCSACISSKLEARLYQPNRSQRRIMAKNHDIEIAIKPAIFSNEYFQLYRKYLKFRHTDGAMNESKEEDFKHFLICDWCDTVFIEQRINKKLIAVAVTDVLRDGLSAVYTFFDPDYSERSPGIFSITQQIVQAQTWKKHWLYLGYWIADCQKMSYKASFQPLLGYRNDSWTPLP